MHIKVLPLEYWMEHEWMLDDCLQDGRYPEIQSRFNRPGLYLHGKDCWFELANGQAYAYPMRSFKYTLELLEAQRLNTRQAAALAAVRAQGLATKTQLQLLHRYEDAMQIRDTYRGSIRVTMRGFLADNSEKPHCAW